MRSASCYDKADLKPKILKLRILEVYYLNFHVNCTIIRCKYLSTTHTYIYIYI